MKNLFLLLLFFCSASVVRAQAYITVSADNTCTNDASVAINNAITTATHQGVSGGSATGSVIYFPPVAT
jgi:hypothetical protein